MKRNVPSLIPACCVVTWVVLLAACSAPGSVTGLTSTSASLNATEDCPDTGGGCQVSFRYQQSGAGTWTRTAKTTQGDGHLSTAAALETFTTAGSSCPASVSGKCLPIGNLSGWKQVFAEDFSVNSALGSWGTSDLSRVVYTGDHGGRWTEYPDGWPSTYTNGAPGYEPSKVLSTHNGVLDFYLHNVNQLPAGANPSPVMPSGIVAGGGSYQTYGMYSVRMKAEYDDAHRLDDYHIAFLLWPRDEAAWASAESDFPEMTLSDPEVCAFAHYGPRTGNGSTQDAYCQNVNLAQWHTFTQEWGPGYRSYYIDGRLIGRSTNQVWSGPERWQLQTEPSGTNDADTGHVLVDWVTVYARA